MRKSSLLITILLIISITILILSFISKNKDKDIYKVDYASNINFTSEKQLLAIAHLNSIEEISSKYISNFENIKVYQTEGKELFLIIPRYDNINISIYNTILEDETLTKGEMIVETKLPFIITCDSSDIIFEIKYNDNLFEYSPSLNFEDNILNINEYILDITKY